MKDIYIENQKLHFDIPEILQGLGLPDTEANRNLAVEVAAQTAVDAGLLLPGAKVEHTHLHRCVSCRSDWKHDGKKVKCMLPKYAQYPNCKN